MGIEGRSSVRVHRLKYQLRVKEAPDGCNAMQCNVGLTVSAVRWCDGALGMGMGAVV